LDISEEAIKILEDFISCKAKTICSQITVLLKKAKPMGRTTVTQRDVEFAVRIESGGEHAYRVNESAVQFNGENVDSTVAKNQLP
jgi:hypothetical protein